MLAEKLNENQDGLEMLLRPLQIIWLATMLASWCSYGLCYVNTRVNNRAQKERTFSANCINVLVACAPHSLSFNYSPPSQK